MDNGSIKEEILHGENVYVTYYPLSKSYFLAYQRKNKKQGTLRLRFLSLEGKKPMLMIDDYEDTKYYVTDDLAKGGAFTFMMDKVIDRQGLKSIVTD